MPESIEIDMQLAAVTLAEERSYSRAAERLKITNTTLRAQITDLEKQLEFRIFRTRLGGIEVTKEGQVFVKACRGFLIHVGIVQS